jgi:2-keto-4-pentenoate hydratase
MHRILFLALLGLTACVGAESRDPDASLVGDCVAAYAKAFDAGESLSNTGPCIWGEIADQAVSDNIREGVVAYLGKQGSPVGYKVTFADDGRVVGVLMDSMLLPSGSVVDLSSGSRILVEADLIVRVASASINQAKTLEDVAASIDLVYPFMESSNMMLPRGTPRKKATWTATNGNVRWGTLGDPIDLQTMAAADVVARIGGVEVSLFGPDGKELQRAAMSRHPLQSVLDVIDEIDRGALTALAPGDLISLGNFGRPRFPKPGEHYATEFHGLSDVPLQVRVSFD